MTGFAAALLALNALLALAVGLWSYRKLRRETAPALSPATQLAAAVGLSGWCWLLLTSIELAVFGGLLKSALVALSLSQVVCLLVIEAQLLIIWRARSPWRFAVSFCVIGIVLVTLTEYRSLAAFPVSVGVMLALVELSALAVLATSILDFGRAR